MTKARDQEDQDQYFYESHDRLISSSCSTSTSNSDDDNSSSNSKPNSYNYAPKFPFAMCKYDIWISEPSSVSERRTRLHREMGLAGDPSLSRCNPVPANGLRETANGEFARSISSGYLSRHQRCQSADCATSISRSKSCGAAAQSRDHFNKSSSSASASTSCFCSSSILSIHSVSSESEIGSIVNNRSDVVKSRSDNGNGSPVAGAISPSKPPSRRNCIRVDEIRSKSLNLNVDFGHSSVVPILENEGSVKVEESVDFNGVDRVNEHACTIRDLDNGKEFIVQEIREDGMWNKLKELGTGRHLTMEEFEITVGNSPIVQELMRRQNVEEGNKNKTDSNDNGGVGGGSKLKKKNESWFKSIRSVASTRHKERLSSDERDNSSEKGGRRSSPATNDSQDAAFHGPQRVKVRQYGKSCKELTALFKSQEIQAHSGSIWTIKFSLDGKYLASAGEDCVIHVWQVGELERKGELLMDKPDDGSMNMLFTVTGLPEPTPLSPIMDNHPEKNRKGRRSISRKSLSLDQLVLPETVFALTERPICSFEGHLHDVLDLSWSKSQHLLSSSMDKTVRLWHLSSKSCLKIFSHSDYVTCIQFNPVDDRYFISGSLDAKVRIWSIPDRKVVDWTDLHEMVTAACYTPDGQGALVGSYKGSCHSYKISENKLQQKSHINLQNRKKKLHHKKITGFQFVPGSSSEVHITSADSRIRVVDGVDLVCKFKGFRNANSAISASLTANGKYIVSASKDSHVYIWKNEADCRHNRSKTATVTSSYEYFHCKDVSVAIPWPGMDDAWEMHDAFSREQTEIGNNVVEVSSANHPPTPVEESFGTEGSQPALGSKNSPHHGTIASVTNNYFFDKISATWPEEKLLAARNRSPCVWVVNQNVPAGGMVIVTAGLRGEIRTFQNFGLPLPL